MRDKNLQRLAWFSKLSATSFILLINLVSAYNGLYYKRYSFSEILRNIDPSFITLGSIFIISFAILFFSLSKIFKTEEQGKAIPGVIAFALSSLITYQINKTGFDFSGFFSNIGIPREFFSVLLPIILIGAIIFLVVKFKTTSLFILGAGLILLSFTNLIYAKGIIFVIGIILVGVSLLIWRKRSKKEGKSPKKTKFIKTKFRDWAGI